MSSVTDSRQTPARSNRQLRGYLGRAATRFWPAMDGNSPPRASIVLMPGRGEDVTHFERVALRLAVDGYDVTFLGSAEHADVALAEARRPGAPFVLFGSDTGALRALELAGSPALRPDALVLLGLPLLHRAFAGEMPEGLPPRALPDLPTLLIHGRHDEVSPHHLARIITRTVRTARLESVPGGHRVLSGPGARLAAALTVLFVESLLQGSHPGSRGGFPADRPGAGSGSRVGVRVGAGIGAGAVGVGAASRSDAGIARVGDAVTWVPGVPRQIGVTMRRTDGS
ncbi:alpha/beta hydrolase [Frankia sp. CcI49]|uniref:alpha/beta hydrolase n=1 Tax=Frankia sp. CcI49 TaxID=1745382 RepID=UPI000977CB0F|nr:alpha/beta hydrolase [Frankia sp. CcI49]ONH59183.1 alpha/beta hydrolase [Frankia sp. CcI49]